MIPDDYKPLCPHPWKNNGGMGKQQILDADGKEVATVRYRRGFYNADAVAAVPELLECLAKALTNPRSRENYWRSHKLLERVTGLEDHAAFEAAGAYR